LPISERLQLRLLAWVPFAFGWYQLVASCGEGTTKVGVDEGGGRKAALAKRPL